MRTLIAIVDTHEVSRSAWEQACVRANASPTPVPVHSQCSDVLPEPPPVVGWASEFAVEGDEVWCQVCLVDGIGMAGLSGARPCPVLDIDDPDGGSRLLELFVSDPVDSVAERVRSWR